MLHHEANTSPIKFFIAVGNIIYSFNDRRKIMVSKINFSCTFSFVVQTWKVIAKLQGSSISQNDDQISNPFLLSIISRSAFILTSREIISRLDSKHEMIPIWYIKIFSAIRWIKKIVTDTIIRTIYRFCILLRVTLHVLCKMLVTRPICSFFRTRKLYKNFDTKIWLRKFF